MKNTIVNDYLESLIKRYKQLAVNKTDIKKTFELLSDCFKNGGKYLVCGNGGSAADAEHIVGELMKSFIKDRSLEEKVKKSLKDIDKNRGDILANKIQGAIPCIALTGQNALATAFTNDVDPMLCFAQQVYGLGRAGDVLLAITTSGNSENVIYAAVMAKAMGMNVVALTGKDGGKIAEYSDITIVVPEYDTYKIQELHLPIYHTLCLMLEEEFF